MIDVDEINIKHQIKLWKFILIKDHKIFIILPEGGSKVTIRSWVKICKKKLNKTQTQPNENKKQQQIGKTMEFHLLI